MTHRDRAGDPSGRRKAAGDAGHPPSAAAAPLLRRTGRQGFPTSSGGSPGRPLWVIINAPWYYLGNVTYMLSSRDSATTNRADIIGYFAVTQVVLLFVVAASGLLR